MIANTFRKKWWKQKILAGYVFLVGLVQPSLLGVRPQKRPNSEDLFWPSASHHRFLRPSAIDHRPSIPPPAR
jgi:hypothetical protein